MHHHTKLLLISIAVGMILGYIIGLWHQAAQANYRTTLTEVQP